MFAGIYSPRPSSPEELLELAGLFTPRAELHVDLVLLDLSGTERLWPEARHLAEALQAAALARGSTDLHIAIARTRVCARLVARSHSGVSVVASGEEAQALAGLSLAHLDLPDDARETFRRWGVRRLGELAALPTSGLVARLGSPAARWQQWARGEDREPLTPAPSAESFEVSLTLDWPLEDLEPLSFVLASMLPPLAARLEARGQRAAELGVSLTLASGAVVTRTIRTAAPTLSPRTWRTLLLLELESHPPSEPIQAIAVRAEPTSARATQFSLLRLSAPSPERLVETLARLSEWTAHGRGGSPCLLPTHRPDSFLISRFDAAPVPAESGCDPAPPRLAIALRAYRPPRPIDVRMSAGAPAALWGSGLRGDVSIWAGPWRASGDWWDAGWGREEWDVQLAGSGCYRIFRDLVRHSWFVEGELD